MRRVKKSFLKKLHSFVCLKLHFSKERKGFKPKQEMDFFGPPELFKNIFEGFRINLSRLSLASEARAGLKNRLMAFISCKHKKVLKIQRSETETEEILA